MAGGDAVNGVAQTKKLGHRDRLEDHWLRTEVFHSIALVRNFKSRASLPLRRMRCLKIFWGITALSEAR